MTLLDSIDLLVDHQIFDSRSSLQAAAYRSLLTLHPELKIEIAILLYRKEEVSLGRAAELAGISRETLKEVLESRGIERHLFASNRAEVDANVARILGRP
jgi:predicted HTH domain antitoxin